MSFVPSFPPPCMQPVSISLDEMLAARDLRQRTQTALLERFGLPLVCATLSIAGPIKDGFGLRLLFADAIERLCAVLPTPVHTEMQFLPTSPIAYLCIAEEPSRIKAATVAVEDSAPAFRLMDLDVLTPTHEKLDRAVPRTCLLCDRPAHECARSRAHGLKAVQDKTRELVRSYAASRLAELSVRALCAEVAVTPKAGLVDASNCGSHPDMSLALFEASAQALRPFFASFVSAGADRDKLTEIGLAAERAMLAATNGINTHRGAIYCFGLTLGALGESLFDGSFSDTLLALTHQETESVGNRHGQQTFLRYGLGGAKTEARHGFPHAKRAADLLLTERPQDVFLWLLSAVTDSTLLYRGGVEAQATLQARAAEILRLPVTERDGAHRALDAFCMERGWTAGGAADLLALGMLLRSCADAAKLDYKGV